MKPLLDPSFWSDPDIESAKSGVKLAALWLITNSQTSLLGICNASDSRFSFETGLPAKALSSALEALPRAFVKIGSAIFVRNYIRHQFGSGEKLMRNNFFVALKSQFISVKDEALKAEILTEYPEFQEALTKGLPRACQAQGKERIGEDKEEGSAEGRKKKARGTIEELRAYCREQGLPESDGTNLFDKWEGTGWKNDGKPIVCWKSTIRSWRAIGCLPSQKNGSSPTPKTPVRCTV